MSGQPHAPHDARIQVWPSRPAGKDAHGKTGPHHFDDGFGQLNLLHAPRDHPGWIQHLLEEQRVLFRPIREQMFIREVFGFQVRP